MNDLEYVPESPVIEDVCYLLAYYLVAEWCFLLIIIIIVLIVIILLLLFYLPIKNFVSLFAVFQSNDNTLIIPDSSFDDKVCMQPC